MKSATPARRTRAIGGGLAVLLLAMASGTPRAEEAGGPVAGDPPSGPPDAATGTADADAPAGDAPDTAVTACIATDDYPTTAVADYVLGCMVANGNTFEALQQCSCSIDFIKARMDYTSYEQAGTVLQVQRDAGQRGIFYRDSNWAKARVERLEALQAESTLRCF